MNGENPAPLRTPDRERSPSSPVADATLYVFPGSHACRSAMLMLEHKRLPYRRVDLTPGLHPISVRIRGFPGHRKPIRSVNGSTHRSLGLLDRVGTVPALRIGNDRIQTNRSIARYLDRMQPQPPLFPADETRRLAVEEAERWGDEVLQMAARRIVLAAALHGLDTFPDRGGSGRLGPLMSPSERVRMLASRVAARTFLVTPRGEQALLEELPPMLDAVDAWIEARVLNGEELNVADLTIAPSLALLAYRSDLRPGIEARPAGALMERVLPAS